MSKYREILDSLKQKCDGDNTYQIIYIYKLYIYQPFKNYLNSLCLYFNKINY